jgi:glycosyltransferase involved in cell wall biosynthesis
MGNPLTVSVVIPTWNASRWIVETLTSVLGQTLQPLDITVVDDGSVDGTPEIVRRFEPRVRLVEQENAGGPAARNRGVVESAGQLIAFLDNDDLWEPEKLESQVTAFESDESVGLAFCDYSSFGGAPMPKGFERGPVLERLSRQDLGANNFLITSPDYAECLLDDLYCQIPSTWVVRRSAYQSCNGFDTRLRQGGEDLNLAVRLGLRWKFAYNSRVLVRRRERPDSLGRTSNLEYSYVLALELLLQDTVVARHLAAQISRRLAERALYLPATTTLSKAQIRHLNSVLQSYSHWLTPRERIRAVARSTANAIKASIGLGARE